MFNPFDDLKVRKLHIHSQKNNGRWFTTLQDTLIKLYFLYLPSVHLPLADWKKELK